MTRFINRLWKDTRAQDLIEYALLCGLLALSAAATMPQILNAILAVFAKITALVNSIFG
jgi:Flp pilus assembly pilin Flp